MSNKTFKVFVDKMGGTTATTYIGNDGELFYDPTTTTLRIGDGTTPGGTVVSAGGGGATGNIDITSTRSQINFVANSSGDGYGYSTIEMIPDTNTTQDQYLIIDPTAPSHIHIRAGGTQDQSQADLYLGGERTYVRVRDNSGVRINRGQFSTNSYYFAESTDYDTAVWSTDESGNHWIDITITNPSSPTRSSTPFDIPFYSFNQYPQNNIVVYDGNNYTTAYTSGQIYTLGNQYQLRVGTLQAPPANSTSITNLTFYVDTYSESALILENDSLDLYVNQDAYLYANQTITITTGTGNIQITADDNNTSRSWYFTAQGYMQFPQGVGPSSSKGQVGDEAGSVVFDGSYIYYCTTDYTDGIADIWKRVAWSNDTW